MKALLFLLSTLVVAGGLLLAGEEPAEETHACQFALSGEPAEPTITGPDNVVPLVHIIDQPDSPVEIVAIDFEGTRLSIYNEQFSWEPRCKLKIRNRSDRHVEDFHVLIHLHHAGGGVGTGGNLSGRNLIDLAPGQETEFLRVCGGHGGGPAPSNHVRILVGFDRVDLRGCHYRPSMRLPHQLRVAPIR